MSTSCPIVLLALLYAACAPIMLSAANWHVPAAPRNYARVRIAAPAHAGTATGFSSAVRPGRQFAAPPRQQLAQFVGGGRARQNAPTASNPQPGYRLQGPGPHRGDWLRRYGNLPADQMQRQLEQDKDFQRLSPERQQILRQRLNGFTNLPPDKKQQVLNRMEFLEHLPPEQQTRVEGLFQQFRSLDPNRRQAVMQQLRYLRSLRPDQRSKVLDSGQFKSGFNEQEQQLIRGLNDVGSQGRFPANRGPGF